jgi:hypothetical protein
MSMPMSGICGCVLVHFLVHVRFHDHDHVNDPVRDCTRVRVCVHVLYARVHIQHGKEDAAWP